MAVHRTVALPRGGTLEIRAAGSEDVDGLLALYQGLDDDAIFRRFFSIYRPRREFFERTVQVAECRGAELVAVVTTAGAASRIVAEAGYVPLPNGNGELAITVAKDWRGWLGPYLLDALLETAARRGIPNLEADVLAVNGPMLALLRSRGYALLPYGDWTVVRAAVATEGRTPSWSPVRKGPRILVESGGGRWAAEAEAVGAGMEVMTCHGPEGRQRCPVLAGQPCPLAAGADAIVISHPPDDAPWHTVRDAHPRLHADVPVCVHLGRDGAPRPGEIVLGCDRTDPAAVVEGLAEDHAERLDR